MKFKSRYTASAILMFACASGTLAQTVSDDPELVLNPGTADELAISILLDEGSTQPPVSIDPATGDVRIFTADPQACSGSDPDACPTASVLVAAFSPDPATVTQGGSFTASLGSLGATACRRTGLPGTSWEMSGFDSPPPDGNRTQTVPSDVPEGLYTLRYECVNGDFDGAEEATLEVVQGSTDDPDPPPVPVECEDVPLPTGWRRDTTSIARSSASTLTWEDVFDRSFPNTQGENVAVNEDRYAALRFDPSNAAAGASGELGFGDLSNLVTTGIGTIAPTISISACPGDFRPELGNCRMIAGEPFRWTTDVNDTSGRCILPDAGALYLNITYILSFSQDDPSGFIWTCSGESECGHFVQ